MPGYLVYHPHAGLVAGVRLAPIAVMVVAETNLPPGFWSLLGSAAVAMSAVLRALAFAVIRLALVPLLLFWTGLHHSGYLCCWVGRGQNHSHRG